MNILVLRLGVAGGGFARMGGEVGIGSKSSESELVMRGFFCSLESIAVLGRFAMCNGVSSSELISWFFPELTGEECDRVLFGLE